MEKKNKNDFDSDALQKSDLNTIIEVNNKAIELQTEVSDQYEEIISSVKTNTETLDSFILQQNVINENIKEINREIKEINKLQFKIMILISTGIVSLIVQIASLIKH